MKSIILALLTSIFYPLIILAEDNIQKQFIVDKNLKSNFFTSYQTSLPWYIIKHEDGTFENTFGEKLTKKDKIPIEHTSNTLSTHQGEHIMNFSNAILKSNLLEVTIYGGLPAYSSSLRIEIKDRNFKCFFEATYPAPTLNLKWKILSKKLILKNGDFKKGERLYGWIFLLFEESSEYNGKVTEKNYKIEGYFKPIIE